MRDAFWLVWNEFGQAPTVKHVTVVSAEQEAVRLMRIHGGTFHVLRVVGRVRWVDLMWEWDAGEEPPPF